MFNMIIQLIYSHNGGIKLVNIAQTVTICSAILFNECGMFLSKIW